MQPQIILASASIGRRGLLEKLGLPFSVHVSSLDEEKIIGPDHQTRLLNRAKAKAQDVAGQFASISDRLKDSNSLIIAADSEAVLGNTSFGKSRNQDHTKEIVRALMGKTHEFHTATAIIHLENGQEKKSWEHMTKTLVSMRAMTEEEIAQYATRYDFRRFAAAYTINETPWDLITKIDGSYTSVIGLPFEVVLPIFRELKLL